MRASTRPDSLPISPAATCWHRTAPAPANTSIAVIGRLASPSRTRSRTRSVPWCIRTYVSFPPDADRSILKTRPDAGAARSRGALGRRDAMPSRSVTHPAPVSAEPTKTGWTRAAATWRSSSRHSASGPTSLPATYRPSRTSECSASTPRRSAQSAASRRSRAPARASRVPRSRATARGTTDGLSREAIPSSVRSTSAPNRSILLMNSSVGTPPRCSARIRIRVWGCTPWTAETTSTAPSSTPSARSTSAMKSGCPGVSIRLTPTSPMANEATAERMVIPRRRSSSSESVCVVPLSTLPISAIAPASKSRRSVSVVLPAST